MTVKLNQGIAVVQNSKAVEENSERPIAPNGINVELESTGQLEHIEIFDSLSQKSTSAAIDYLIASSHVKPIYATTALECLTNLKVRGNPLEAAKGALRVLPGLGGQLFALACLKKEAASNPKKVLKLISSLKLIQWQRRSILESILLGGGVEEPDFDWILTEYKSDLHFSRIRIAYLTAARPFQPEQTMDFWSKLPVSEQRRSTMFFLATPLTHIKDNVDAVKSNSDEQVQWAALSGLGAAAAKRNMERTGLLEVQKALEGRAYDAFFQSFLLNATNLEESFKTVILEHASDQMKSVIKNRSR